MSDYTVSLQTSMFLDIVPITSCMLHNNLQRYRVRQKDYAAQQVERDVNFRGVRFCGKTVAKSYRTFNVFSIQKIQKTKFMVVTPTY